LFIEFTQNNIALNLKLEDTFIFKQGENKGEKKKQDKIILSLYKKGKLTLEDIADATEVSVQYFKDIKASLQNEPAAIKVEKKYSKKSKM
jgi:hypothetical protein